MQNVHLLYHVRTVKSTDFLHFSAENDASDTLKIGNYFRAEIRRFKKRFNVLRLPVADLEGEYSTLIEPSAPERHKPTVEIQPVLAAEKCGFGFVPNLALKLVHFAAGEIRRVCRYHAEHQSLEKRRVERVAFYRSNVRLIFNNIAFEIGICLVVKLDRVYFAGLTKKNVRRGDWRYLTEKEVQMLRMGAFE